MRGYAASMFVAAMLPRCEALVYARLCRLDVRRGFASPYQLLKRDMGYAHRSGYAPGWAGGRTRGTAPIHSQKLTARHSLASHRGGAAARNEKSLHAILLHTSRRRGRKKREVVARDSASHIEAAQPQQTRSHCTRFCLIHRGGEAATNEKSLHAILLTHRGGEAATNEKSLHAILLTHRGGAAATNEKSLHAILPHIEAAQPQQTRSHCTRFCLTHRGGAAATNEKSLHAILLHTSRRRSRNKREVIARDSASHIEAARPQQT